MLLYYCRHIYIRIYILTFDILLYSKIRDYKINLVMENLSLTVFRSQNYSWIDSFTKHNLTRRIFLYNFRIRGHRYLYWNTPLSQKRLHNSTSVRTHPIRNSGCIDHKNLLVFSVSVTPFCRYTSVSVVNLNTTVSILHGPRWSSTFFVPSSEGISSSLLRDGLTVELKPKDQKSWHSLI